MDKPTNEETKLAGQLLDAIDTLQLSGPTTLNEWEPGEDADNDALVRDVIIAAVLLTKANGHAMMRDDWETAT